MSRIAAYPAHFALATALLATTVAILAASLFAKPSPLNVGSLAFWTVALIGHFCFWVTDSPSTRGAA